MDIFLMCGGVVAFSVLGLVLLDSKIKSIQAVLSHLRVTKTPTPEEGEETFNSKASSPEEAVEQLFEDLELCGLGSISEHGVRVRRVNPQGLQRTWIVELGTDVHAVERHLDIKPLVLAYLKSKWTY